MPCLLAALSLCWPLPALLRYHRTVTRVRLQLPSVLTVIWRKLGSFSGTPVPSGCAVVVLAIDQCARLPPDRLRGSRRSSQASGPPCGVGVLLPWVRPCLLAALSLCLLALRSYRGSGAVWLQLPCVRITKWRTHASSTGVAVVADDALVVMALARSTQLPLDSHHCPVAAFERVPTAIWSQHAFSMGAPSCASCPL